MHLVTSISIARPFVFVDSSANARDVGWRSVRPVAPTAAFRKSLRFISTRSVPYRLRKFIDDDRFISFAFLDPDVIFGQKDIGIEMTGVATGILRGIELDIMRSGVLPCRYGIEIREKAFAIEFTNTGTGGNVTQYDIFIRSVRRSYGIMSDFKL